MWLRIPFQTDLITNNSTNVLSKKHNQEPSHMLAERKRHPVCSHMSVVRVQRFFFWMSWMENAQILSRARARKGEAQEILHDEQVKGIFALML